MLVGHVVQEMEADIKMNAPLKLEESNWQRCSGAGGLQLFKIF